MQFWQIMFLYSDAYTHGIKVCDPQILFVNFFSKQENNPFIHILSSSVYSEYKKDIMQFNLSLS